MLANCISTKDVCEAASLYQQSFPDANKTQRVPSFQRHGEQFAHQLRLLPSGGGGGPCVSKLGSSLEGQLTANGQVES